MELRTFVRSGAAMVAGLGLMVTLAACGDDDPVDPGNGGGGDEPTLTAVDPSSGVQGNTVTVTLTGTNFVTGGTTVDVSGTGVTVSSETVASATSMTAVFEIAADATTGDRNVTVTTDEGTSGSRTFTVQTQAEANTVRVDDGVSFTPSTLTIEEGQTVTWTHDGTSTFHTITPDGHNEWVAQDFPAGADDFTHTFDTRGTYDYICVPHEDQGMTGTIIVEAAGS